MTSGSLTDLDPPQARDRRWPFYVAWTMGGLVVGAVLVSHLPASLVHPQPPVAGPALPAEAPARITTVRPAQFRTVTPPQPTPVRVAPAPIAPARP